jgi:hypothetical protein
MYSQSTSGLIEGVHRNLVVGQFERLDEINNRISSRHFSDYPLEPNFSPRPVSTKYNLMPIMAKNSNPEPKVRIQPQLEHIVGMNFNPATRNGPYKTYARNVDTETVLRNQTMAFQKSSQSIYVPSSDSDLYKVTVVSKPVDQPYKHLFDAPSFVQGVHPNLAGKNIGKDRFFNSTRTQLREPTKGTYGSL